MGPPDQSKGLHRGPLSASGGMTALPAPNLSPSAAEMCQQGQATLTPTQQRKVWLSHQKCTLESPHSPGTGSCSEPLPRANPRGPSLPPAASTQRSF